jgi:coenzyme F420-reducing hydrogenase delta subunit
VGKVRKVLDQLGLGTERLQLFEPSAMDEDPVAALERFTGQIGELYLESLLKEEVKS